jgi:hypothetical protein
MSGRAATGVAAIPAQQITHAVRTHEYSFLDARNCQWAIVVTDAPIVDPIDKAPTAIIVVSVAGVAVVGGAVGLAFLIKRVGGVGKGRNMDPEVDLTDVEYSEEEKPSKRRGMEDSSSTDDDSSEIVQVPVGRTILLA